MTTYTWAWIMWALMFVAIEGHAVVKRNWDGTLTHNLQELFKIKSAGHGWRKGALYISRLVNRAFV